MKMINHTWGDTPVHLRQEGRNNQQQCKVCGVLKYLTRERNLKTGEVDVVRWYELGHLLTNNRPNCIDHYREAMPQLTPQTPATVKTEGPTAEELAALFKSEMDKNKINPADVIALIQRSYSSEIEDELATLEKRKAELIALRYRLQR